MPFSKEKRDDKWVVINSDSGDVKGTHDSESEADAQLAALYANVSKFNPSDSASMFIPITKVDLKRHEVWGVGAKEEYDHADEILDYSTSKKYFMDWSNRAMKRSGGQSLGNVRSMHQPIAAGKLISLQCDDKSRSFVVGAKIVDDDEWKKVESGVYTGFSVGGRYADRWPDPGNPGKIRYTADPAELSLVDAPCIPSATFTVVKGDGMTEQRQFKNGTGDVLKLEDMGSNETRDKLNNALAESFPYKDNNGVPSAEHGSQYYICDIKDDFLIVNRGESYFRLPFTELEGKIQFGTPVEVERKTIYIDKVTGEALALSESAGDLEKVKGVPQSPEHLADIPIDGGVQQNQTVQRMPDVNVTVLLDGKAISTPPASEAIAKATVDSKSMEDVVNQMMPHIGVIVEKTVRSTLERVLNSHGQDSRIMVKVIRSQTQSKMITVKGKEPNHG